MEMEILENWIFRDNLVQEVQTKHLNGEIIHPLFMWRFRGHAE
jgi:hypothetical protein